MAFYGPSYIKGLIKEDHATLQKRLADYDDGFRRYIDSTIPFALYLDINEIRNRIILANPRFFIELAELTGIPSTILANDFEKAYKKVINNFIDTMPHMGTEELEQRLNNFELDTLQGNIKSGLKRIVTRGTVLIDASVRNKRVVVLYPSFATLKFGAKFREAFDLDKYSTDLMDNGESQKSIIEKFISGKNFILGNEEVKGKGFSELQNIGHIEVDVISTTDNKVIRGLVSPRLAQAAIALPKDIDPEKMFRQFSKQTGQAETRLVVRKQFTGSKLVMELLVTYGISVGTLESRETNLRKSQLEKAFEVGKGFIQKLKNAGKTLVDLVTSKSISQYVAESVVSALSKGAVPNYSSNTTISDKATVRIPKVNIKVKKAANTVRVPTSSTVFKSLKPSLASLQALLNYHLQDVVSANMGDGNSRNVLNYRTGRLAASAKVERLTQSKEGMITAFYSYMRNPYSTFSEGGRQQYPKSRDPKLLISKSIREIAAEAAVMRMRAVLV